MQATTNLLRNARYLESRNKREGEYSGRSSYCKKTGHSVKPHHSRSGSNPFSLISLKG